MSTDPESGRSLVTHPPMSPPVNPTHLDANWLLPQIADEQARTRAQFALKKVTKFVESPKGKEFPQTSTVFQRYELKEFEANRHLGYVMGWAYLSNIDFSDEDLRPSTTCRVL